MEENINKEYILWLEGFTSITPHFSTETCVYYPGKFSEEDNNKIKELETFYNNIHSYASENYIYPTIFEHGKYYNIKFNDIGYRIISLTGDMRYSCNRIDIYNEDDFIDFNDILNNKKQPKRDFIDVNLKLFANFIDNMVEANVPIEAIDKTTKDTLNKVLVRRKENK